ncbi:MAG: hypothetical protein AABY65_10875 [Nitrospirota bacterium]|jgi:hypothetical protein
MDSQVKQCPWESIDDFASLGEFNRFVAWMNDQVKNGLAEETLVTSPYMGATAFEEKWFRHVATGQVWRLVWPDGPFHGLFERFT